MSAERKPENNYLPPIIHETTDLEVHADGSLTEHANIYTRTNEDFEAYVKHLREDHGLPVIKANTSSKQFGMPSNWNGSNWKPKGPEKKPWAITDPSKANLN